MNNKKIAFTWPARLIDLILMAGFAGLLGFAFSLFDLNATTFVTGAVIAMVVSGFVFQVAKVWLLPGLVLGPDTLKIREPLGSPTAQIPYSKITAVELVTDLGKPRIMITSEPVRVLLGERSQFTIVPEWYAVATDELIADIQHRMKASDAGHR